MLRFFFFGAMLLALGCPRKKEEPVVLEATRSSTNLPPPSNTPMAPEASTVGEKLALEASSRPAANPKAEVVLDALQKSGLHLKNQKQHAGAPVGAGYCVGAESDENVSLSICEYRDQNAARDGKEASERAFRAIANREVFLNRMTTLTLLQYPKNEASEAAAKRAVEAFQKL